MYARLWKAVRSVSIRVAAYALIQRNATWLHRYWPARIRHPVFIVGCPRSGTSIFGHILGQTPHFCYLAEPKYIWVGVNPKLDTWEYRLPIEQGVLSWDATDANARDSAHLARWFHLELFTSRRRRRLIEKMPQNVFRLLWMNATFPTAKFIHLIRNGCDVALSLKKALAEGYPSDSWESSAHYGKFCDYASNHPALLRRLEYITDEMDNYPRCLFVWLCAVTAGRQAGRELGPDKYLEVRYEHLIMDPERELRRVFDFIAEPMPEAVVNFANGNLRADSIHKTDPNPVLTQAIVGDLLRELGYSVA